MHPLFDECFPSPTIPYIDPLLWVLLVLAVIGVILTIAVFVAIDYQRRRRSSFVTGTANEKTIESTANDTTFKTITTTAKGLSKLNQMQQ